MPRISQMNREGLSRKFFREEFAQESIKLGIGHAGRPRKWRWWKQCVAPVIERAVVFNLSTQRVRNLITVHFVIRVDSVSDLPAFLLFSQCAAHGKDIRSRDILQTISRSEKKFCRPQGKDCCQIPPKINREIGVPFLFS